jgi:phage terminase large subunit
VTRAQDTAAAVADGQVDELIQAIADAPPEQQLDLAWLVMMRIREDPVWFLRECMGQEPWGGQIRIIDALKEHRRVAVPSATNLGKTHLGGGIICWFMCAYPQVGRVMATSSSWQQLKGGLWGEVRKQYAASKVPLGGKLMTTELRGPGQGDGEDPMWVATGISTKTPETFKGHHAEYVLVVLEEATGIEPPIWDAAESLLSGDNAFGLAFSNPKGPGNRFYDVASERDDEWATVRLSAFDHPNLIQGRDEHGNLPIPAAISPEWVEKRRQSWGENHPMYKAFILGEDPDEGEWQLVSMSMLERCADIKPEFGGKHMGVDVARQGMDRCVATFLDDGRVVAQHNWGKMDLMRTAGVVQELAKKWWAPDKPDPQNIHVDVIGIGAGVVDRLKEAGWYVDGVDFGGKPRGDWRNLIGRDIVFKNRRAELHWVVAQLLREQKLAVPERYEELWADLLRLEYRIDDDTNKVSIVSKDKLKKAAAGRSPDFGDSLVLAHSRAGSARVRIRTLVAR